ncbi:MAG: hypothetical protein ACHQXA_07610 [Gemmatimonadales bacterium]
MTFVDPRETVVLVFGATGRAASRDRALALRLQDEVVQRGRRAVVVSDEVYDDHPALHGGAVISVGGPGVNRVSAELLPALPAVWAQEERVFVQSAPEGAQPGAVVWGMDADATADAVDAFIFHGELDRLLGRLWRFPRKLLT